MKVEVWDTRFGTSVRVVVRRGNGKFINNKSAKQIVKVVEAQAAARQQAMANHPAGKGRKR